MSETMTGCDQKVHPTSFGNRGLYACLYCPAWRFIPLTGEARKGSNLRSRLKGRTCRTVMGIKEYTVA